MADNIEILLLHSETEARLNHQHVYDEVERISERVGRDFRHFIQLRDGDLWFVAPEGALKPENWIYVPRFGTNGASADSPPVFALYFLTVTGMPFARHHIEWADFIWECFDDKVGAIIEAFRGSGKSIFMRMLLSYLIGRYPELSSMIIRSADTAAKNTAEGIAKIISDHKAWKLWFPPVLPKSRPGQSGGEWSAAKGYSVIDISRDNDEWNTVEASRTSPTLTKFGMGSKSVLGSRVTLAMLADDIHDEENSDSPAQLERMITRFQGIVEKCRTPNSRLVIIGTPWGTQDLLQRLPQTGEYRKIKTPITLEGAYPGTPAWPEYYTAEWIDKEYNKDLTPGKIEFKRNQLLDLAAKIALQLTWEEFPHRKVEDFWPVRMGIDFAELEETASGRGRSYFSVTVTTQEPKSGTWIVIDGFLGQVTQEAAENLIVQLARKYEGRVEVICMESIGGGAVFQQYMSRTYKNLPVIGEKGGGVPKEVRWERMLAPYLGTRRILISDDTDNPFLVSLRTALSSYPNIAKRGDWAADILDSMVWAHFYSFLETGDPVRRRKPRERKPNPWTKLARMGREDEEKDEDE